MSDISSEYERIVSEIEGTISDKKTRESVIEKVEELSKVFIDNIKDLNLTINNRLKILQENEENLNKIVKHLQKTVNEIERDIYDEEDGEFDFEIVCPYCDAEFVTDLSLMDEEKNEIKCPECDNIIELDWNDEKEDFGCSGGGCCSCSGCGEQMYYEDYLFKTYFLKKRRYLQLINSIGNGYKVNQVTYQKKLCPFTIDF